MRGGVRGGVRRMATGAGRLPERRMRRARTCDQEDNGPGTEERTVGEKKESRLTATSTEVVWIER
jgi:hypothetical protein